MRDLWARLFADHEDDRLSAFLDDELDVDEALEVTRHLARCQRCLDELEEIRSARLAVRGLPDVPVPLEVAVDVIAGSSPAPPPRVLRAAAALGASAALVAGVYAAGHDEGTVRPPVEVFVADHVVRLDAGPFLNPVNLAR